MKDVAANVRRLAYFNFFTEFKFYSPIVVIVLASFVGNYTSVMTVLAVTSLTALVMEFPTGLLSDMVGRKTTIILGALCNIVGVSLWAVLPLYPVLLLGAFFMGTAMALFSGNNEALLFDSLRNANLQAEYQKYLGKTSSTLQVALAITSMLAAVIATWSMQAVLLLSIVPQFLALGTACSLVDPGSRTTTKNPLKHLHSALAKMAGNRRLVVLTLARGLGDGFSHSSYQMQVVFFNSVWPLWAVGLIRGVSNLLGAASFYFAGNLLGKLSQRIVLITAHLYGRFSALLALLVNNVVSPPLLASASLFFGVAFVANSSLMQAEFSDEERATMGSIVSFSGALILSVISIFVGYVADHLSVRFGLVCVQICMFIPVILYWRVLWKKNGRAP